MSASAAAAAAAATAPEERMGIDFAPVKDSATVAKESAAAPLDSARDSLLQQIPPIIRSVLEYAHYLMIGHSQYLRAAPGYQGGLFYKGKPYCFSGGYRDSSRPLEMDDKSNHMRIKDALIYGNLSTPIAVAYMCELHGQGVFDLMRPLADYLPELQHKLGSDVTGRSILSYMTVLRDTQVLRDAGAHAYRPLFATNICSATQRYVYDPVRCYFSHTNSTAAHSTADTSLTAIDAKQQRANLVHYVQSAPRAVIHRVRRPQHAQPSHFSVALLVAAVERQLRTRTFEQAIHTDFFQRVECHGSNYGAPRPWRNPADLFYKPTGQARQHISFRRPLPKDDKANCGPAMLNASLNLYAPPEEFAKLLLLSVDTIRKARRLLQPLPHATQGGKMCIHYDFGVLHKPKSNTLHLRAPWRSSIDFVPSAAAFRYDATKDIGCFGVANCGTRNARTFANTLEHLIYYIFSKYALKAGNDIDKPFDIDSLDNHQQSDDNETTIDKMLKKTKLTNKFTRLQAHRNR